MKLITPATFSCTQCGECCIKTLVPLQKQDITKIKKAGFKEEEFVVQDVHFKFRKLLKKKENGWCVFLKKKKEKFYCSIYEHRPFACRQYPFFSPTQAPLKSCLPEDVYPNVFFKVKKSIS